MDLQGYILIRYNQLTLFSKVMVLHYGVSNIYIKTYPCKCYFLLSQLLYDYHNACLFLAQVLASKICPPENYELLWCN